MTHNNNGYFMPDDEWSAVPDRHEATCDALVAMGYALSRVNPDTGVREIKQTAKAIADAVAAGYDSDRVADFVEKRLEEYLEEYEEGDA
jgi:hypothetical protein